MICGLLSNKGKPSPLGLRESSPEVSPEARPCPRFRARLSAGVDLQGFVSAGEGSGAGRAVGPLLRSWPVRASSHMGACAPLGGGNRVPQRVVRSPV